MRGSRTIHVNGLHIQVRSKKQRHLKGHKVSSLRTNFVSIDNELFLKVAVGTLCRVEVSYQNHAHYAPHEVNILQATAPAVVLVFLWIEESKKQ